MRAETLYTGGMSAAMVHIADLMPKVGALPGKKRNRLGEKQLGSGLECCERRKESRLAGERDPELELQKYMTYLYEVMMESLVATAHCAGRI